MSAPGAWRPAFVGIGAMKAATTWIEACLSQHPEICTGSRKEIHFFDVIERCSKGPEHYRSFFPDCRGSRIVGEFTPRYLFDPDVPHRIHAMFPDVRLIACLRNPIDRAYSQYRFGVEQRGRLSVYRDFEDAIERDEDLVPLGRYGEQLERYLSLFPRERVHVGLYENIAPDPVGFVQEIYRFLGADPDFEPAVDAVFVTGDRVVRGWIPGVNAALYRVRAALGRGNAVRRLARRTRIDRAVRAVIKRNLRIEAGGADGRASTPMADATRNRLRSIYEPDIRLLERLLEIDLSAWT